MKSMKKIALALGSALVIGSFGMGGTAAAETTPVPETSAAETHIKEDRKLNMQETMEKWDALSPEQKASVYALAEERMAAENAVMDKLAQLQVLDADMVSRMKQHRQEIFEKQKQAGKCPLMGHHHRQPKAAEPAA